MFADHNAVEMRLSSSDHNNIYTKLKDHAKDWREIGGALGFSEGELDNIQANHMLMTQSPPTSYLRKMLSQWLQWAPGDERGSIGYATMKSLKSALLKVNLGRLADRFE